MSQFTEKKSFTLLELMIVIAVLGILVTLLLPSLSKAREKGKRAVCLSNVSQQLTLLYSYGSTNNNKIPLHYGTGQPRNSSYFNNNNNYMNMGLLWKKGFSTKNSFLICPSFQVDNIPNGRSRDWVVIDSLRTEANRRQSNHSDYSYRPENRDRGLVNSLFYADKALISEDLYARYSNRRFHRELNITGFGDGHAKMIYDRNGTLFMNRIKVDRSSSYYRTKGLSEPTGVWGVLDKQF